MKKSLSQIVNIAVGVSLLAAGFSAFAQNVSVQDQKYSVTKLPRTIEIDGKELGLRVEDINNRGEILESAYDPNEQVSYDRRQKRPSLLPRKIAYVVVGKDGAVLRNLGATVGDGYEYGPAKKNIDREFHFGFAIETPTNKQFKFTRDGLPGFTGTLWEGRHRQYAPGTQVYSLGANQFNQTLGDYRYRSNNEAVLVSYASNTDVFVTDANLTNSILVSGLQFVNFDLSKMKRSPDFKFPTWHPNRGQSQFSFFTEALAFNDVGQFVVGAADMEAYLISPVTDSPPVPPRTGLASDERLLVGQSIFSPNGEYVLTLQMDGNLVQYKNGVAVWHTDTYGAQSLKAVMHGDGNFVLYGSLDPGTGARSQPVYFSSNTLSSSVPGVSGATLTLQDDGDLVIYDGNGQFVKSIKN